MAQEQTFLILETASASLQTGQEYEIAIRIENAPEVWLANVEIAYDPALLYVIGTRAGSPVQSGDFFLPAESLFIARNLVREPQINYTISLLAPANPVSGSGVIGTFRIYPIAPGMTQLRFTSADLTMLVFSGEGEQRTGTDPFDVPFTPVLLDLTITGEPVEPPSEATATPLPTETATSAFNPGDQARTQEPTLVNVTAAPLVTVAVPDAGQTSASSAPLLLAIAAVVIGAVGLLVLLLVSRRRR
jgi:hypothetical protein